MTSPTPEKIREWAEDPRPLEELVEEWKREIDEERGSKPPEEEEEAIKMDDVIDHYVDPETGEVFVKQQLTVDPDELPPPERREYVESMEEAPEGVELHQGPEGGVFYDRQEAFEQEDWFGGGDEHAPEFEWQGDWRGFIEAAPEEGAPEAEYRQWLSHLFEPLHSMKGELESQFGDEIVKGRVKKADSTKEKREDREKDLTGMDDLVGLRVVDDAGDLDNLVRRLHDWSVETGAEIREIDDGFVDEPAGGYYKAAHFIVTLDGVPAEIQVMSEPVEQVKEWAQDFADIYKGENEDDPVYQDYAEQLGQWAFAREEGQDPALPECPPKVRENKHCYQHYEE